MDSTFVIYDGGGTIVKTVRSSLVDPVARAAVVLANTPEGHSALAIPDHHDAIVHGKDWKVGETGKLEKS